LELIPKAYISGLIMPPPGIPGGLTISAEKINRIWAEIGPANGYTQFQTTPDYSAVNFLGPTPEMGVTIQPPLLQFRDLITMTTGQSAEKAETVYKAVARHLGVTRFFQLGVKLVYHAPAPGNDAKAFVLGRILGKSEADLGDLAMGGSAWGGVKFSALINEAAYVLLVEPLLADNRMLFLDLDVQFPGEVDVDKVVTRSRQAEEYLTRSVNSYLDRLS
jgi:hypothetical protein